MDRHINFLSKKKKFGSNKNTYDDVTYLSTAPKSHQSKFKCGVSIGFDQVITTLPIA